MSYENNYKNKYWVSKYLDLIFKKLQFIEKQIGGGSQTLDQVLEAGNEGINKEIIVSNGDNYARVTPSIIFVKSGDLADTGFLSGLASTNFFIDSYELGVQNFSINMSPTSFAINKTGVRGTTITESKFSFFDQVSGFVTSISNIQPIADNTFNLPAKPDGVYTLATTDDTFLRKNETLNGYERELTFDDLLTTAGFFADEATGSKFYITSQKGSEDLFREFGIKANDAVGSIYWVAGNSNSEIQFEEPLVDTGATKYKIPSPKLGDLDKTYTFAMESAVSGTFANPTSITVVNGIITAIS